METLQGNFVQDQVPNGPVVYTTRNSDRTPRRGRSVADLKGVKVTHRDLPLGLSKHVSPAAGVLVCHLLQRVLQAVIRKALEDFGIPGLGLLDDLSRHFHVGLAFLFQVRISFQRVTVFGWRRAAYQAILGQPVPEHLLVDCDGSAQKTEVPPAPRPARLQAAQHIQESWSRPTTI